MKQHLSFLQQFVLFVTPLLASSALVTAPSQAATFASSEGEFNFTNINKTHLAFGRTDTDTNAIAIANGGMVTAIATLPALGAVYYISTAYTERAFLQPIRLFKRPLNPYLNYVS